MLATLGARSFSSAAPELWNALPSYIRNEQIWFHVRLQLKFLMQRL